MSSLLRFHKRILFFASVCFFLSQSLKASEFRAWKYNIPLDLNPTYPFAQIIIQNKPKPTLTLVYAVPLNNPRAKILKIKFQHFLRYNSEFDKYIDQDQNDHDYLEHFGCDKPYRNHAHIAFKKPLDEDSLNEMIALLELGFCKREMLILFQRFFEDKEDEVHLIVNRVLKSVSSLLVLQGLIFPSDSL